MSREPTRSGRGLPGRQLRLASIRGSARPVARRLPLGPALRSIAGSILAPMVGPILGSVFAAVLDPAPAPPLEPTVGALLGPSPGPLASSLASSLAPTPTGRFVH